MPKAYRHQRAAKLAGVQVSEKVDYEITDPAHVPDLRGEFAGAKVRRVSGKQFVRLSAAQAKFYLDQGVLKPASGANDSAPKAAKKALKK